MSSRRRLIKFILSIAILGSPFAAHAQTGSINLVQNGDFSQGPFGFKSSYLLSPDLGPTGTFAIGTNPQMFNPFAPSFADHSGSGLMLIANGAGSTIVAWEQTIAVEPGTEYSFAGYVADWSNDQFGSPNPVTLAIVINGTTVTNVSVPAVDGAWTSFRVTWASGEATSATIQIVDLVTAANGNDFALDDLSLTRTSVALRSIDVQPEVVEGGTAGPGAVTATFILSGAAPAGGVSVRVSVDTVWPVAGLPPPIVATADDVATIPEGRTSVTIPIETIAVDYPLKVQVRGSFGGFGKVDSFAITPVALGGLFGGGNERVTRILDQFIDFRSSPAEYRTARTNLQALRNVNAIASQDIHLAAAEHYLVAAELVLDAPLGFFNSYIVGTGGVLVHAVLKALGFDLSGDLPQSQFTVMSAFWGQRGVYDALWMRFGPQALVGSVPGANSY